MRPTPFYVQVTLGVAGRRRGDRGAAGSASLRGQHLQRREADRTARRAGVFGSRHAGGRDHSGRVDPFGASGVDIGVAGEAARRRRCERTRAAGRIAASGADAAHRGARAGAPSPDREIRVTVVNDTPGAAESGGAPRSAARAGRRRRRAAGEVRAKDESQTVRFQVKPAPNARDRGEFRVARGRDRERPERSTAAIRSSNTRTSAAITSTTLRDTTLKVIDVRTPANLTVGYVMGVGDQVPPAIEQLGAKVEMITADDLAWGNLSRFDAIVTGVRAYERRDDLRANNSRLLDYVFNGGTVIVQYNKFEFNDAQYGPYPAQGQLEPGHRRDSRR